MPNSSPTPHSLLSTQHSVLSTSLPVLSTQYLSIGYPQGRKPPKTIAADINVDIQPGEMICLIGPNGAGKSTLMRTLAGMQPPLHGTITLNGDDLSKLTPQHLAQRLSIVLTERIDVGILSAYALVALGRHPYTGWLGRLTPQDEAVVQWAMKAVGAADLAARNVIELSDGERQKVMIARALAQEPALMMLDEPTAFLDLPRRAEIMTMLRTLARETKRAILLSTHDLDLALRTADRIWLLPKGGALQVGAPEDLVLSGAFEAAFRGEGVTFDAYTGSFRGNIQPAGTVDLHGEGLPALWTERALERAGFCIVRNGTESPIRVETLADNQWQLTTPTQTQIYDSVHALIAALQNLSQ